MIHTLWRVIRIAYARKKKNGMRHNIRGIQYIHTFMRLCWDFLKKKKLMEKSIELLKYFVLHSVP